LLASALQTPFAFPNWSKHFCKRRSPFRISKNILAKSVRHSDFSKTTRLKSFAFPNWKKQLGGNNSDFRIAVEKTLLKVYIF